MFDEFEYNEKVELLLKTYGLKEDVARNFSDPSKACFNPWGYERVMLAKKYLETLPEVNLKETIIFNIQKSLKKFPYPKAIKVKVEVMSTNSGVKVVGEMTYKNQKLFLNFPLILKNTLDSQVTEPRLWWFLSELSPFYNYDFSVKYQEQGILEEIEKFSYEEIVTHALGKITSLEEPAFKPKWAKEVTNEEHFFFEGFDIFIAQSKEEFLWVAFDQEGGSEDGACRSLIEALNQAKSMVQAFKFEA